MFIQELDKNSSYRVTKVLASTLSVSTDSRLNSTTECLFVCFFDIKLFFDKMDFQMMTCPLLVQLLQIACN